MKKRKLAVLALSVAAAAVITACSGGGSTQESSTQETTAAESSTESAGAEETSAGAPGTEESSAEETEAAAAEETADEETESQTEAVERPQDPFEAYGETVTVTIGRQTVSTGDDLLNERGWTYEDNAVINWYEKHLNVEIEFEEGGEDYDSKVREAMDSGNLPDVMQITSRDLLQELVEKDLIADLTSIYQNYASDAVKQVYDSYENAGAGLKPATFDGKIMALPGSMYGTQLASLVWFRQDWLDQLGITIDEDGNGIITRAELEMVAREFVEKDPGGSGNPVGIANYTYMGDQNRAIFSSFHSYPEKWMKAEDGTVYNGSTTPETKEALAYLHGLYEEGLLDPEFGTRQWEGLLELAANNQLGIFMNTWTSGPEVLANGPISCYVLGDDEGKVSVPISDTLDGGFVVVRKDYEHPEAAMKLLNLKADVEYGARISDNGFYRSEYRNLKDAGTAYSLEPFTYCLYANDDLQMKMYKPVRDYVEESEGNVYGDLWEGYPYREQYVERFLMPDSNGSVIWTYYSYMQMADTNYRYDYYKWYGGVDAILKSSLASPWNWVDCIYVNPTTEMRSKEETLSQFTEETFVKMIRGEMSVDEFDSYVSEWEEKGGTEYCEEAAGMIGE